jgi:hypothetical protein
MGDLKGPTFLHFKGCFLFFILPPLSQSACFKQKNLRAKIIFVVGHSLKIDD